MPFEVTFCAYFSLVDEGWQRRTAVINFGVLKRIQTPHSLLNFIVGFWGRQNLHNPLARLQSSSLSPSSSPCQPVPVIWQSLQKAILEDNWMFWLQNQWLISWGSAPAQVGRVWLASTNTGCFLVCCSRCRQQPACLRKTCYHCCNTDSLQQSKRFNALYLATTSHFFFLVKWNFQWNWQEVNADQSLAHCLAQSCTQS